MSQTLLSPPAYFELLPVHGLHRTGARVDLPSGPVRFRMGGLEVASSSTRDALRKHPGHGLLFRECSFNPMDAAARTKAARKAEQDELERLRRENEELKAASQPAGRKRRRDSDAQPAGATSPVLDLEG